MLLEDSLLSFLEKAEPSVCAMFVTGRVPSSSHPSGMFQGIPGPLFQTPGLWMPFTVVDLRGVQHGLRQPQGGGGRLVLGKTAQKLRKTGVEIETSRQYDNVIQ